MIDLTLLDATTTDADVDRAIDRAIREGTAGIVVGPALAKRAVGRGIEVVSVVGYPLGLNKPTIKAIEATSLAKDGVAGVEVTPRAASLVAGDVATLRQELLEIARGARAASPTVALHVRIDLDLPGFAASSLPSIAQAVAQSAFDGLVFDSSRLDALVGAFLSGGSPLRRKAIARDAAWVDRPARRRCRSRRRGWVPRMSTLIRAVLARPAEGTDEEYSSVAPTARTATLGRPCPR